MSTRIGLVACGAAVLLLGPAAAVASAGTAPDLMWSPVTSAGNFDYGTAAAGTTTPQTFTLTNNGGSASAALTITITGTAFTLQNDHCTGTSLGPYKHCTVQVTYTGDAAGDTDTGALTVTGNKVVPADTARLNLTGQVSSCIPGSENFNEVAAPGTYDTFGPQPTTFSGGTMSGYNNYGGIYVAGLVESWVGFTDNILFTGSVGEGGGPGVLDFTVTFTHSVKSLSLLAMSAYTYLGIPPSDGNPTPAGSITLTGYDASNNVVGSSSTSNSTATSLSVSSPTANIAYFTITGPPTAAGAYFTDMNWGC